MDQVTAKVMKPHFNVFGEGGEKAEGSTYQLPAGEADALAAAGLIEVQDDDGQDRGAARARKGAGGAADSDG